MLKFDSLCTSSGGSVQQSREKKFVDGGCSVPKTTHGWLFPSCFLGMECDTTKVGGWDCFKQCFTCRTVVKWTLCNLLTKNNWKSSEKYCTPLGQAYLSWVALSTFVYDCYSIVFACSSSSRIPVLLDGCRVTATWPQTVLKLFKVFRNSLESV